LYSDVIPWLLEPSDPSVRYWTLTKLLEQREENTDVFEARQAIMARGPAVEILSHYAGDGRWKGEKSYYTHKYNATHWQLILLAELAADGQDERIAAACRRMMDEIHSQSRETAWPCLLGNVVGYLNALGHAADERAIGFTEQLAQAGTEDRWRCEHNNDLPCAWGAARALWGFGHVPAHERSDSVNEAIESGVRFLGRFKLRDGNYPASGTRSRLWDQISFPLFYQSDVLFTLRALADLGHLDTKPTFRKAVEWLEKRRCDDGRWNGADPYGSKSWVSLEKRHRPSKWITWQALYVIKNARQPFS
jgi:hypothetical protein